MKTLRIGDKSPDVLKWEYFLIGQGILDEFADGYFDERTQLASQNFQMMHHLEPDGIVGNKTIGAAMMLGFEVITDPIVDKSSQSWPPPPTKLKPLTSNSQRAEIFGKFSYKSKPQPNNKEHIEVTDNWAKENIVRITIPQLIQIKGTDTVYFHKKAKKQMIQLWKDWEEAELLHLILTWHGTYMPRFIRGSKTTLSNHAFGSAFDINYSWNKLGAIPALAGRKGSVRELVEIANKNGFYWGGHFKRLDGMHFEIAEIKS
jgi:hypothetical protein